VQAILLAESELGCRIEIDVDKFAMPAGVARPQAIFAHGTIEYASGGRGVLHVVKLGVTDQHSSILREYQRQDPGFPYHSTLQQVYKAERFEAYRRLGVESTEMMLNDMSLAGDMQTGDQSLTSAGQVTA
jgi:hypothetical protein